MKQEAIAIIKKIQKNEILQEILVDIDLKDIYSDLDILRHLEAVMCDGAALATQRHSPLDMEEAHELVVEAKKNASPLHLTFIQLEAYRDDILFCKFLSSYYGHLKTSARHIYCKEIKIEVIYDLDIWQAADTGKLSWDTYRTSLKNKDVFILNGFSKK